MMNSPERRAQLHQLRKHTHEFLRHLRQTNSQLSAKSSLEQRQEDSPVQVSGFDPKRRERLEEARKAQEQELDEFRRSMGYDAASIGLEAFPQDKSRDDASRGIGDAPFGIPEPPTTKMTTALTASSPDRLSTLYEQRTSTQRSVSPLRTLAPSDFHRRSRVRIGKFGLHSGELPAIRDEISGVPAQVLKKSEDYFEELERFRRENPTHFFEPSSTVLDKRGEESFQRRTQEIVDELDMLQLPLSAQGRAEALARGPQLRQTGVRMFARGSMAFLAQQMCVDTGGYFHVNERYFPTKAKNPFLEQAMYDQVLDDDDLDDEANPPVKISIPNRVLQAGRKTYKPHTRSSFEPGDSINVREHLHFGYAPLRQGKIPLSLRTTKSSSKHLMRDNMSFRKEVRLSKVVSFPNEL